MFSAKLRGSAPVNQEASSGRRRKPFRIELGWKGLFSLLLVTCCLFLWMFLLGLWAGQTILLPAGEKPPARTLRTETKGAEKTAVPEIQETSAGQSRP